MSDIFAMRRANGDWFAVEANKRLRVPLFYSSHEARMARLRNIGMQLFQPVALNAHLLKEIAALASGTHVDFSMVTDPFGSLTRGKPLELAEIEVRMANRKPETSPINGNGFRNPSITTKGSEWWN